MRTIQFVLAMLASAAFFMAARWMVPHFINAIAVYVAVALCSIAMAGAVIGVIKG